MPNNDIFSLKDKNILITGASSGIGKAIALECSTSGAKIIGLGRDATRLQVLEKEIVDKIGGGYFYLFL